MTSFFLQALAHVLWEEFHLGLAAETAVAADTKAVAADTTAVAADTTAVAEEAPEVIVGVGGGHYCPKIGDLARKPGVYLGHVLASYAVKFADVALKEGAAVPSAQEARQALDEGGGAHAVEEAIKQTRATYGGECSLRVVLDKKAFQVSLI